MALAAELCDGWVGMLLSPHEQFYAARWRKGSPVPAPAAAPTSSRSRRWSRSSFTTTSRPRSTWCDRSTPCTSAAWVRTAARTSTPMSRFAWVTNARSPRSGSLPRRQEGRGSDQDPVELIQKMSLLGPADKIRHDLEALEDSLVTTLMISGDQSLPRQAAESRGITARPLSAGRRLAGVADAARMRTRPVMSRSSRPGRAAAAMCDCARVQHPLGEAEAAAPPTKLMLVVATVGVEAVSDRAGQKAGQRPASAGCSRPRLRTSNLWP